MVLIFSSSANSSKQIRREVERAVNGGVPIIPVRIENVAPTEAMAYFMSTVHWLDAMTAPLDNHLQRLAAIDQGAPADGRAAMSMPVDAHDRPPQPAGPATPGDHGAHSEADVRGDHEFLLSANDEAGHRLVPDVPCSSASS